MKRGCLVIGCLAVAISVAVLLALDLHGQGFAWRWFWSITGEERPLNQIKGLVEWLGNFTRAQPRTAPDVPINHTWENPYGVNTFLQQEVEVPKIEQQLAMIREAGFYWLRQEFPWADLEVDGRGQFTDSRNDLNGDGQPDTVDAWAKYDRIVNLAEKHGLRLQVRLSSPPKWSYADSNKGDFAPPDDLDDFVRYAAAVAARYKGRIHYYQIWNEPNIYPEWGEAAVNPEAYTDLLCRTYRALKAVDPDIVVISGALAQTNALDMRNLSDFVYMQRMYSAGAGACFDIFAMQGYGLNSGPTDRRMRVVNANYSRNLYIRDIMVANGDAHKPIWISEASWNAVPDDPSIIGAGNYGRVTLEQAARYMPLAYQRAQQEWPWVGVINYWFFTRPSDAERSQAFYYFRMVEPDYSPQKPGFTPLPVYNAVKDYIREQQPVLYPGVHQAEDWRINHAAQAQVIQADAAQFGQSVRTLEARFTAHGTRMLVRWRGSAAFRVSVDGQPGAQVFAVSPLPNTWQENTIYQSALPATRTIRIDGVYDGLPFEIDSITVIDRTWHNLFPYVAGALIAVSMLILVVIRAMRERRG